MFAILGYILGREGGILGASHILVYVSNGGIFWEGGVDSGSVVHSCWKCGYILRKGVDSGSVLIDVYNEVYSGREGVYSGRAAYIHVCLKKGVFWE